MERTVIYKERGIEPTTPVFHLYPSILEQFHQAIWSGMTVPTRLIHVGNVAHYIYANPAFVWYTTATIVYLTQPCICFEFLVSAS